jgi:hypothetical protein
MGSGGDKHRKEVRHDTHGAGTHPALAALESAAQRYLSTQKRASKFILAQSLTPKVHSG